MMVNPFNKEEKLWEYEQWERLKDVDTTLDENENKEFDDDSLNDYHTQAYLKAQLNPSPSYLQAQSMLKEIDDLVESNSEWKDMPKWAWSQSEFYDKYFQDYLERIGGEEKFKELLESTANRVIPDSNLSHDTNGPTIPRKLKVANYKFDGWSHHYLTSNGKLSPNLNHWELDQYVLAHAGVNPNVVFHQGWLEKYANAMSISYLNGEFSVSINTRLTKDQEKRLLGIIDEVLKLGGKLYWSYPDKNLVRLNGDSFSGNSVQGLLWFIDDKEKNKIDKTGVKYGKPDIYERLAERLENTGKAEGFDLPYGPGMFNPKKI